MDHISFRLAPRGGERRRSCPAGTTFPWRPRRPPAAKIPRHKKLREVFEGLKEESGFLEVRGTRLLWHDETRAVLATCLVERTSLGASDAKSRSKFYTFTRQPEGHWLVDGVAGGRQTGCFREDRGGPGGRDRAELDRPVHHPPALTRSRLGPVTAAGRLACPCVLFSSPPLPVGAKET